MTFCKLDILEISKIVRNYFLHFEKIDIQVVFDDDISMKDNQLELKTCLVFPLRSDVNNKETTSI